MLQQRLEQGQFAPLQRDAGAVQQDFAARQVQREAAVVDAIGAMAGRAPYQRLQPRGQFIQIERLEDVVVGAGAQRRDALRNCRPGGQHQDRQVLAPRAPLRQQCHAVAIGQAEIQHTSAGVGRSHRQVGLPQAPDRIDHKTLQPQPGLNRRRDGSVILDQQNAHRSIPVPARYTY